MVNLKTTSYYGRKDQLKANVANKFIGRGSPRSSTNRYRELYKDAANCGHYSEKDIVFISAEGNRKGRLQPDFNEIELACIAGVTFITDNTTNRNRPYNMGERQVAEFLISKSYHVVEEKNGCAAWQSIEEELNGQH